MEAVLLLPADMGFQRPVSILFLVSVLHSLDPGQISPLYAVLCICIAYIQMYIYEILYLERERS